LSNELLGVAYRDRKEYVMLPNGNGSVETPSEQLNYFRVALDIKTEEEGISTWGQEKNKTPMG
jgi:hypothetical protein